MDRGDKMADALSGCADGGVVEVRPVGRAAEGSRRITGVDRYVLLISLLAVIAATGCRPHQAVISRGTSGKEEAVKEQRSGAWSPGLSGIEKETLFLIAEDTLDWCVSGCGGRFDFSGYDLTEKLKQKTGTFVTLKNGGMLRGCIGSLVPVEPLYKSVHNNAVNAALKDTRFLPVGRDERSGLELHISILSPIEVIPDIQGFRLGEHGIIIEKAGRCAVYLPEVAMEQGWTVEQTMESLCLKAGLPPDGWKSGARFSVFSSAVLSAE